MKCAVIYFSQTGNTEKVALAIQQGVLQAAGHCDLIKLKEANPHRLYEYDLIGLGSMVFDFKEPANLTAFIGNLKFLGGKHVFSFCTHCTMGFLYFPSVIPKLKKRGVTVIGWCDWYGHNWGPIHNPTPYGTDGHPDEIDLREAEGFGREMVRRSQKIHAGDTSLIPEEPLQVEPPVPNEETSFLQEMAFRKLVRFHREKCLYPSCRLCMDNCPMDGIDLSQEPPVVARPCLSCYFCEQLCPTGAIDADEDKQEQMAAIIRKVLKEVGAEHLKQAEATGRFRRLIPLEKLNWETPIFKVYNRHPRWIIGKGPNSTR